MLNATATETVAEFIRPVYQLPESVLGDLGRVRAHFPMLSAFISSPKTLVSNVPNSHLR